MEKLNVLIVENDPHIAHCLAKKLQDFCTVEVATHKNQALFQLENTQYNVALIDLNLTHQEDLQGLSILKKAKELGLYCIVLSEVDNAKITKLAYQSGCDHFLSKFHFESSLVPYLKSFQQQNFNDSKLKLIQKKFITNNSKLVRDIKNLLKLNLKNRCLHLCGETGVGKSFFAKTFHDLLFPESPFVAFNCSQTPATLIDSELFGHKKGAFTGAEKDYKGLLERSNGGTLFLDEIGTMPIYTQQKLLKAIEEKEFTPLGSERAVKVDFTLISATCDSIAKKIEQGSFRKDFYYRISGYELNISPLRERKEDIETLLYHFLSLSPRKFFIEEDVIESLKEYSWEGNIRELRKLVDTLANSELGIIDLNCPYLPKTKSIPKNELLTADQKDLILNYGLSSFLKDIEKNIFEHVYNEEEGKVTKVIQKLQISNSAYYRMFKEFETTTRV